MGQGLLFYIGLPTGWCGVAGHAQCVGHSLPGIMHIHSSVLRVSLCMCSALACMHALCAREQLHTHLREGRSASARRPTSEPPTAAPRPRCPPSPGLDPLRASQPSLAHLKISCAQCSASDAALNGIPQCAAWRTQQQSNSHTWQHPTRISTNNSECVLSNLYLNNTATTRFSLDVKNDICVKLLIVLTPTQSSCTHSAYPYMVCPFPQSLQLHHTPWEPLRLFK